MRIHREMPWLWRSLVSIACTLPASACVDAIVGEVEVCEYEGKGYKLNEKFSANDGCNTCTCTIEGEVECTARACDPVTGCDQKDGCADAGGPYSDAGGPYSDAGSPCDSKLGCYDAGIPPPLDYCRGDASYKPGETFRAEDGCSSCVCDMLGNISCDKKVCYEPDAAVAPGTCEYAGTVYMQAAWFPASDGCNKCFCTESGVVECTVASCHDDAGLPGRPVEDAGLRDGGVRDAGAGSCIVGDKLYRVGEGFERGDNCNKCTCVADGFVECTSNSCAPPAGCFLGNQLIHYGESVTCEDGCNTCTCQMDKRFTRTERACPTLPPITKCLAASGALQLPAALVYQTGDALAVSESRCVSGQTNDFTLCYDDLVSTMGNEVTVFAVAGGGTRACAGTERVYSLTPLRDDYLATFPGRTGGKIVLRGSGQDLLYQFGM
jgi:hypothetical protein